MWAAENLPYCKCATTQSKAPADKMRRLVSLKTADRVMS